MHVTYLLQGVVQYIVPAYNVVYAHGTPELFTVLMLSLFVIHVLTT